MNLQTLSSEARAGHIEGLDLISMEGGIYLLQAHIDGRCHTLDAGRGLSLIHISPFTGLSTAGVDKVSSLPHCCMRV